MAQELHRVGHLHERVAATEHDAFEALASFEGFGLWGGPAQLEPSLVYASQLDTDRIWCTAPETGIN